VAVNEDLVAFVKEGLARGVARPDIETALAQAGWRPAQVANALGTFADITFPVPVPKPRIELSARDAFLYLVLFSTLYITAYSFGTLIFTFINHYVPDPSVQPYGITGQAYLAQAIRWSVSALIVAAPVLFWMSWITQRDMRCDPIKRLSKVRRWLTYLTLFFGASVLIGDFICIVYYALGGELTLRFVLKAATVGSIAGTIFGNYLTDLRSDEKGGQ